MSKFSAELASGAVNLGKTVLEGLRTAHRSIAAFSAELSEKSPRFWGFAIGLTLGNAAGVFIGRFLLG